MKMVRRPLIPVIALTCFFQLASSTLFASPARAQTPEALTASAVTNGAGQGSVTTGGYVDFSESLTKGAGFRYFRGSDYVDFRLKDSEAALAITTGNKTLFDVPTGRRIEYTASANKLKEDIVVSSRPETNTISFDFSSSGLAVERNVDGSYSLYESGGAHVFDIEAPTVVDAKGRSGLITLDIDKFQNSATLRIDQSFLDKASYPITVDPTVVIDLSAGGLGLASQRNTFYDTADSRWWVLYSDGTNIRASYSTNGTSWTQSSSSIASVDSAVYFSTWFDGASAYVAYRKSTGYAIYARKGTVNSTTISWGSEYTVFPGSSSTNTYTYPSIAQSTNGKLWVAARYYNGSTYKIRARISANASDVSSWDATIHDVSPGTSSSMLAPEVIQLPSSKMYAAYIYGAAIRGNLWTPGSPGSWGSYVSIASTYNGDFEHIPSAVVDGSDKIILGYADTGQNIKYKTLSGTAYSSWAGPYTLAADTGQNVVLTYDTGISKYYAFYAGFPGGSNKQARQVKQGESTSIANLSDSTPSLDQATSVRETSNKSYLSWRRPSDYKLYFSQARTTALPSTAYSISPSTPNGLNGWYVTTPTVTLTGSPSGVTSKYKWNSDAYATYTAALTNAPDRNNTLYYYSYDEFNQETAKTSNIKVDRIKPSTTDQKSGTLVNGWYSSDVTVTLSATDNTYGSGIKETWHKVNTGNWTTSTTTFVVSDEGTNTVYYYSKDNAGNTETTRQVEIKIDKAAALTNALGLEGYTSTYVEPTNAGNLAVNLFNGNLIADVAGLSRPARGMGVSFNHNYNSKSTAGGAYGYGWTINYARRLDTSDPSTSVTYTDEDQTEHTFTYDSQSGAYAHPKAVYFDLTHNPDGTFTLKDKAQVKSTFDASGTLTTITDRNLNTVSINYSGDLIASIIDGSDATYRLSYDAYGRLDQITTPDGRTSTYGYDEASGDLTSVKNTIETTQSAFEYENHKLVKVTNALGRSYEVTYTADAVTKIIKPNPGLESSPTVQFAYGTLETTLTDPRNYQTKYKFNPRGLLSQTIEPSPGGTTTYAYDTNWNLVEERQPNSGQTLSAFDANGNLLDETDALGYHNRYEYNSLNDTTLREDPLGHQITYSYDTTGNLTKETNVSMDTSTTGTYDGYGQKETQTNARGYTTTYEYTSFGQVSKIIQPNEASTTKEYDAAGQETTATNERGFATVNKYDNLGRVLETIFPNGSKSFFTHDLVGNKIKEARLADVAIADMEADEGWSGGATDTVNFKQGVRGRKVAAAGSAETTIAPNLDLAGDDPITGQISEWIYVEDTSELAVSDAVELEFGTTTTTLSYSLDRDVLANGWNWVEIAKSSFGNSGIWANVIEFRNTVNSAPGQTAEVTFDDLKMLKNKRLVETADYDALNRVTSRADVLGNVTYYTYDASGNQTEQTDTNGTTRSQFDAMHNQTVVVDTKENTTTTTYDATGNQLSVTDAEQNVTNYEYDKNGNTVAETDAGGVATRRTYGHGGNQLTEGVGALSLGDFELGEAWTGATYDTAEFREGYRSGKLSTTGNGVEVSMTRNVSLDLGGYEDFSLLISPSSTLSVGEIAVTFFSGTDSLKKTFSGADFGPDWTLKRISQTEFSGSANFDWSSVTKLKLSAIDSNQPLTVNFDGLGAGARTLNRYAADGKLTGATDQDGNLTSYEFDKNGNQTKIVSPLSSESGDTTNIYNSNDRLQSTTDGAGKTTSYEYDLAGQETTVTLPTGDVKTVSYDNTGRISRINDASATTDYSYDLQGNAIEQKKTPGLSEYFTYDDANRQVRTVNSQGRIRNEQKDHSGKSTQVIDENGIVDYRYDAADLLTELKVDGETSNTFSYNKVGNRTRQTQANGANTAYGFDGNGRLVSLDTSTGAGPLLGYSYGYDDKGNITTETANGDTFVYTYDANSQLMGWAKDESMTVGYEANALPGSSNPTWTVESAGSPGQSVSGGMLTTSGTANSTLAYSREESGFNAVKGTTVEFRLKNSDVFHGTYGTALFLSDGSKMVDLRFYPNEVRLELARFNIDTYSDFHTYRVTLKNGIARLYVDGILRLTETNLPSTSEKSVYFGDVENLSGPSHTEYWDNVRYWSFAPDSAVYDANGNRTKSQNQGKTTSYTYGVDNRLVSSGTNGQTTTYGYDASGNLTTQTASGETTTYGWSADNELLAIAGPSKAAAFTYDTEGKRLSKTIGGVTTQFVYDGIKLIAEKDASGTVTAKYFYDSKGQLVSMKKGGQSYYFHLNHRGDVVKITDASQTVVASYAYDPWGNIQEATGTFADQQPFRYASYYWDSEIGMYYLMARYYDPGVGRFISKDPAQGLTGESSAYAYVKNNPIKFFDPSGLWREHYNELDAEGLLTAIDLYNFFAGMWYAVPSFIPGISTIRQVQIHTMRKFRDISELVKKYIRGGVWIRRADNALWRGSYIWVDGHRGPWLGVYQSNQFEPLLQMAKSVDYD